MMTSDLQRVVRDRMRRAGEMLRDAEALLAAGGDLSAVNRAYYAAFHAARALLASDGYEARKHAGVLSEFARRYVKSGRVGEEAGRTLRELYEERNDADYEDFVLMRHDRAEDLVARARDLVATVEQELRATGLTDLTSDGLPGDDTYA